MVGRFVPPEKVGEHLAGDGATFLAGEVDQEGDHLPAPEKVLRHSIVASPLKQRHPKGQETNTRARSLRRWLNHAPQ